MEPCIIRTHFKSDKASFRHTIKKNVIRLHFGLLHHFPNLRLLHLDLQADEQRDDVIEAKRDRLHIHVCHDVEQQFGLNHHTAFFLGRYLAVGKEMQERGDFRFQLLQEVGVVTLERHNLPHPVACPPASMMTGRCSLLEQSTNLTTRFLNTSSSRSKALNSVSYPQPMP